MSSAGTMSGEPAAVKAAATSRWRIAAARILVVLATILAAISAVTGYVRYQALDTPTVEDTAGELIANDAIQAELAATLVDQLYANVDVAGNLEQQLPAAQKGLAAPLAGAIRELSERTALRLLDRPRVQALWVQSVEKTHAQLVLLLNDRGIALRTENGDVVLDLRPLVIQLGDQVAIVGKVAERLPADTGKIEIMSSDDLRTAQRATHLLDILGRFLWIVTLGIAALAVWLAAGRRRTTLRSLAIGLIVAGLLVLVLRRIAGKYVVDGLVPAGTTRDVVSEAWNILTALLVDGGRTLVGVGVIAVLGLWLAGDTRSARASRRELAPLAARWEIAYGSATALLLLFVWWGPVVQLRRPQIILVFAILLALGVGALRRQILREYPDAANTPASAPFAHAWAALRGQPRARVESGD
jgi:hypothetical protein